MFHDASAVVDKTTILPFQDVPEMPDVSHFSGKQMLSVSSMNILKVNYFENSEMPTSSAASIKLCVHVHVVITLGEFTECKNISIVATCG